MATLTTTITEALTLNGKDRGSTNTLTVTGINDVYHRIITCPDDVPVTVATFHANVGTSDASLDIELVKYIRITNLDGANPVIIDLQIDPAENDSAASDNAALLLEAGKSFIMGTPSDGIVVNSQGAAPITATSSLVNLESIIIDPLSEAVKVEVFIASA